MNGGDNMLFTTAELILLILIVTIILIIFILLTLNEIRDYRVSKRKYLITDDDKDEVVNDMPQIELIDIMINGKNYVFDANNYRLNFNEMVNININGFSYNGVVTRSNYNDYLSRYEQIPTKLVLEEKAHDDKVEEVSVNNYQEEVENNDFDEYIPKKNDEI